MRSRFGIVCLVGLLSACGSASPATHTLPPSDTLVITLVPGLHGWSYPPVHVVSHNQPLIHQFLTHAETLSPFPIGTLSCVLDNGYSLHIVDQTATGTTQFIGDAHISGCGYVDISKGGNTQHPPNYPPNYQLYAPDTLFWSLLSHIAGQTLPPKPLAVSDP